ncbi:MAG: lipopolysaccharide kinase [Planctomycetes bacterium]|nr:lipopolysaccharide kinase [Planctomycetota bacterium]
MKETLWQRLVRGGRRVRQRPEWERFAGVDWPERIMTVPATDRFHAKQGRSTGRWIVQAHGARLAVYLKRHYHLPRWRGLLAALWPRANWSPALQEWRHLEWAQAQGMPVPAAMAACEYIGPWGKLQSFLAVQELTGMLALHEAIPAAAARLKDEVFQRWKRGLLAEVVRLVRALHERCYFHKDLYLCHFFILQEDLGQVPTTWRGRVHLIDLHRLGYHPWTRPLWQAKDLGQLLYSSEIVGLEARDRLRFWRCYLGSGRRTRAATWLRRHILLKWWSYRRHNRKKRLR